MLCAGRIFVLRRTACALQLSFLASRQGFVQCSSLVYLHSYLCFEHHKGMHIAASNMNMVFHLLCVTWIHSSTVSWMS